MLKRAIPAAALVALAPALATALVENAGSDCHTPCVGFAGLCPDFCGPNGACCKRGIDDAEDDACGYGQAGCDAFHCCVERTFVPASPSEDKLPTFAQAAGAAQLALLPRAPQLDCGRELPTLLGVDSKTADPHVRELIKNYNMYYAPQGW